LDRFLIVVVVAITVGGFFNMYADITVA